MPEKQESELW